MDQMFVQKYPCAITDSYFHLYMSMNGRMDGRMDGHRDVETFRYEV